MALYVVAVQATGIDFLEPTPQCRTQSPATTARLAIGAVVATVAAPVSEEFFFRGFMFGGLLRWGFWPAAAVACAAFTLAHLDVGSMIPFFCIGMVMAWLTGGGEPLGFHQLPLYVQLHQLCAAAGIEVANV